MTERDDALGERLGEALAEVRREPDVGFERRAREGAEARRSARRARRAAGMALALATSAGAAIWVLDQPGGVPLVREPEAPAVGPTVEPLSPEEAERIVAELADVDKAMQVSADWEKATAPAGPGPGAKKRGLTPAEQQQLRDIEAEAQKEAVRARAEIDVLEIDLQRELERDPPDEKKVGELIEKLAAAEGRARKAKVLAALRVKKLTGADLQRVRLKEPFPEPQKRRVRYDFSGDPTHGTLTINAKPWVRVIVDGRDTGKTTPIVGLPLPPGRHRLTLINEAEGIRHVREVTIEPGQDQKVLIDLDSKTLE